MILFKKQLFDLEVKAQGPTKVIIVIVVCYSVPVPWFRIIAS
jgi:hypothetical protein